MRWLRPCPLYTPPVATTDWMARWGLRTGPGGLATTPQGRKVGQTRSFRGSKSRNKVSVGEPAEGSFTRLYFILLCGTFGWIYMFYYKKLIIIKKIILRKPPTTDLLVPRSMKSAANCEKWCVLQWIINSWTHMAPVWACLYEGN